MATFNLDLAEWRASNAGDRQTRNLSAAVVGASIALVVTLVPALLVALFDAWL